MERIGIGITTRNRREVFAETLEYIIRFAPPDSKIVVVDDASDVPCREATYRFNENVGIAQAKNKCLELLDDCDHIFLFDDDCYPITEDWWQPYTDSLEPHLMYIFKDFATGRKLNDTKILYQDDKITGYSHPRGCMLYFDRKVLDVVGGYDTSYGRWGFEHGDLSNRIYNNDLTTFRYADVTNSNKLFHSADEHEQAQGTVRGRDRTELLLRNKALFDANADSTAYCAYKNNNIILTSYFVNHIDTQRHKKWVANINDLEGLVTSCKKLKQKLVILNDCFDEFDTEYVSSVRIDTKMNPYFQRWLSQYQYLRDHPEIDNVFCVDATDVQLLRDPFTDIDPHILYVGDEPSVLNCKWMRTNFMRLKPFFTKYAGQPLLNCGVVGGSRELVMSICHDIYGSYFDTPSKVGKFEMGIFNYWCYTKYKVEHGRHITTVFKQYENQSDAFFRHK